MRKKEVKIKKLSEMTIQEVMDYCFKREACWNCPFANTQLCLRTFDTRTIDFNQEVELYWKK